MLNLECFTIQRKFHFVVKLTVKFLMTKETMLIVKSSALVATAVMQVKQRCLITRITENGTIET